MSETVIVMIGGASLTVLGTYMLASGKLVSRVYWATVLLNILLALWVGVAVLSAPAPKVTPLNTIDGVSYVLRYRPETVSCGIVLMPIRRVEETKQN